MKTLTTETVILQTNGIRMHVETAGPQDGPLVILLHGFPEYWGAWVSQMESLSRSGFLAVAPDQRGYNLTEKPASVDEYSIDKLAKDVVGIIDHFGREKAVIVGHDWGAAVAWYLAIHFPERVERLVVLNVPHQAAMNRALRTPLWSQLRKSWYIFYFQIPRLPEAGLQAFSHFTLKRSLRGSSRPGTFSREDLKRYTQAWSQRGLNSGEVSALTGGINWYRAMLKRGLRKGQRNFNQEFDLRVRVPMLLLWGDRDSFLEKILADWSMEWVDNGQLVHFPEATHWIHHEEALRVNNRIIDFLEDLLAVGRSEQHDDSASTG